MPHARDAETNPAVCEAVSYRKAISGGNVKARHVVAALVVGMCIQLASPGPARAAVPSCSGYTGGGKDADYSAFAGHKVRVTYYWCSKVPKGFVGPVPVSSNQFRAVNGVHVSFPSRFPGGLGESLSLTENPYYYSTTSSGVWKYRFSVEQHMVKVLSVSNYDFELQVRPYNYAAQARICFVGNGGGCSSWQS